MKKWSIGLMLLMFGILFWNGCTKDPSLGSENYITEKRTSLFQDTSYAEFHHIINILSEQSDSMITFQTRFGYPSVYGTFKKKNETIKITTIPLVKYNKITGIFRIYITHEDSVRIHFYSKENIDSAMNTSLNSKNFHLYNGAIQSYVFSAAKRGETIDDKYVQWLEANQNRLEERVDFYCIEDWDCIEAHRDQNTGIIYTDHITNQIGWSLNGGNGLFGFAHCFLISYECFYDWSHLGWIPSSGNNWNHYPWVTNSSSGGTGNGNNNPKIKEWEEQILEEAKECLMQAGINGARAKAALENASGGENSCNDYNDLLAQVYVNLLEQGKSCSDAAALEEEVEKVVDKADKIIIPENFEEDCPCFNKILENLRNGQNDNWLCDIVKGIDASNNYTQKFEIYGGNRITNTMNADFSEGVMMIPQSYCNRTSSFTDLELTAQFIHEFLHGYISVHLKEIYPGNLPSDFYVQSPFNPLLTVINQQYWAEIVQGYYPGTIISGNQHVLFFTHFKNLILNALHDINGGLGNPSDYEYYANLLINTNGLATSPWNSLLGLGYRDENLNINVSTFDNSAYLNAWNSIGRDNGFILNCN